MNHAFAGGAVPDVAAGNGDPDSPVFAAEVIEVFFGLVFPSVADQGESL